MAEEERVEWGCGLDIDQIVGRLAELVSEGEAAFAQRHGEAALGTIREVQAALMEQFERTLSYVVLWEQFLKTPHEVADAVASVVRASVADDPLLAEWLQATWVEYQAQAGGAV